MGINTETNSHDASLTMAESGAGYSAWVRMTADAMTDSATGARVVVYSVMAELHSDQDRDFDLAGQWKGDLPAPATPMLGGVSIEVAGGTARLPGPHDGQWRFIEIHRPGRVLACAELFGTTTPKTWCRAHSTIPAGDGPTTGRLRLHLSAGASVLVRGVWYA